MKTRTLLTVSFLSFMGVLSAWSQPGPPRGAGHPEPGRGHSPERVVHCRHHPQDMRNGSYVLIDLIDLLLPGSPRVVVTPPPPPPRPTPPPPPPSRRMPPPPPPRR